MNKYVRKIRDILKKGKEGVRIEYIVRKRGNKGWIKEPRVIDIYDIREIYNNWDTGCIEIKGRGIYIVQKDIKGVSRIKKEDSDKVMKKVEDTKVKPKEAKI